MNQLYRENIKRLRSSRYNKKAGGKFTKSNTYRHYGGKLRPPEVTFQEKTRLRGQIEKRNRSQKIRLNIGVLLGAAIAAAFTAWFIVEINETRAIEAATAEEIESNREQEYAQYLSYGDEYMNQGQWYNAAFEYRTSLKLMPESQEALYRLTFSLLRLCETGDRGCDEARKRLEDLEKSDFKPEVVKGLRLRWEGINQHRP